MLIETASLRYWRALNTALRYLGRPAATVVQAERAQRLEPNPARATVIFYSPRIVRAFDVEARRQ